MHPMNHKGHTDHTAAAHSAHEDSLLDIIKRRYAVGEITREQFEQLKRDLELDAPPRAASGPVESRHV